MLCEVCSNIHFKSLWDCGFPREEIKKHLITRCRRDSPEGDTSLYYFHHKNMKNLDASANDGCHFCIMLSRVLNGPISGFAPWGPAEFAAGQVFFLLEKNPSTESLFGSCMEIVVECAERSIRGQFGLFFQGNEIHVQFNSSHSDKTIEESVTKRQDVPRPIILNNLQTSMLPLELDGTTTSPANIVLAKTWLANCMDCHHPCNTRGTYTALPRRVIDLSDLEAPRLISADSVKGQYIALSYKWGNSRKCITTSENFRQRMHSIPVKSLPKTFREATELTRHLGFRYLWIDSLCIIQDSEEDLDIEIRSMDRVYQNATLTIFAAGANDVDSGLSITRDPLETKPCEVNVKLTTGGRTSDTTTLISFYKHHVRSGRYPLFDRGWVLQEQLMSRRCLIFGSRFMSWECLCTRSSEKWPTVTAKVDDCPENFSDLHESSIGNFSYPSTDIFPIRRIAVGHQLTNPLEAFDKWYSIVENYCRRSLSYESDILRALSGLSNIVGRQCKSTYFFGLWLEDLAGGLTWFIRKPLTTPNDSLSRAEEHSQNLTKFPSWSWVSHWNHEIQFRRAMRGGHYQYFECEGIEGSCGESPIRTTENTSTALILRGCLISAKTGPLLADWTSYYDEHPRWVGSVHDARSGKEVGQIAYDKDPEIAKVSAITCFLCSDGNFFYDCAPLSFLALVPTMKVKDEYRRVGLVFLHEINSSGHINHFENLRSTHASNYSRIRLI